MFKKISDTALNYLAVSRNVSKCHDTGFLTEFSRIVTCRLLYKMGPDAYDRRRFARKELRRIREYMNLPERENLQKSLCPESAREQVDNKLLFHEKCLSAGLPTPSVFGAFVTGEGYVPKDVPALRTEKELEDFLNGLPAGDYVVKPITAAHGWGVSLYSVRGGELREFGGNRVEIDRFVRRIRENSYLSFGYMFQEFLRVHRGLGSIMPGPGIGTFRIVTFLEGEGRVIIPFAVVKIPVGDSITDNFDGGMSGNWICPVDAETGKLGNAVGKTASVPAFSEIVSRPDTGAVFRESVVPLWAEARSILVRAALAFYELRTVGWDIAVTDKGVCLLEANWAYGENLIEVALDRGLKQELIDLTGRSLSTRIPAEK